MADEIPAYMYPYVPYSSPYLLLPLLLPLPITMGAPAFLEGWGQDRVRGHHFTARYYYRGVVSAFGQFSRGGGGGGGVHMLLVILNTLMFY